MIRQSLQSFVGLVIILRAVLCGEEFNNNSGSLNLSQPFSSQDFYNFNNTSFEENLEFLSDGNNPIELQIIDTDIDIIDSSTFNLKKRSTLCEKKFNVELRNFALTFFTECRHKISSTQFYVDFTPTFFQRVKT